MSAKGGKMSDWLELELAHRLTPVAAPEGLWERVESGLQSQAAPVAHRASRRSGLRSPRPSPWAGWPVAAMATLALAAGALWLADVREPALDIRQLAATEWWHSVSLQLHSNDSREIRGWLRRNTGLDVPLPATPTVRLEGARVVRNGGQRVAAIEYRVGKDVATLLVARADPGSLLPPHGGRVAAWQARDQVYALAFSNPDRAEAACLLCHTSL